MRRPSIRDAARFAVDAGDHVVDVVDVLVAFAVHAPEGIREIGCEPEALISQGTKGKNT